MKTFRVVVIALLLPSLPVLAKTVVDKSAAPLDEYFGAQKMSAIGIRMRIDELGRRYSAHTIGDADVLHDALIAEQSYHAWDSRYPHDRWLAPTAFHLEQLYAELQLPEARTHATSLLHFIADNFGSTRYAHLSRLRLAQGFPPLRPDGEATNAGAPASPASSGSPAPSGAVPAASASPSEMPPVAPSVAPSAPG